MTVDLTEPLPAITIEIDAVHRAGTVPAEFEPALIRGNPNEKARLVSMTLAHLVSVLTALTAEQRHEVIGQALGITGLGGFETDPRDSAALEELRSTIDDAFSWYSDEDEEAGDYEAHVRRCGRRLDRAEVFIAAIGERVRFNKLDSENEATFMRHETKPR